VRLLDVSEISGDQAVGREREHPLADIYPLKSHTPQALEVAHYLEQRGAMVINSFASSSACQDRALMAQRMSALRGIPFSVSGAVGFIAVSGVAVLNGLVLMASIRRRLQLGGCSDGHHRRLARTRTPGTHDRTRGFARLRADGARHPRRCGGAEAARHGRHRRPHHLNRSDIVRVARCFRARSEVTHHGGTGWRSMRP